jgi:hypothetical protein
MLACYTASGSACVTTTIRVSRILLDASDHTH